MKNIHITYFFYFLICFTCTNAFIPAPIIAAGGQTGDSITHTQITQYGFIRSLARFFYDTRIHPNNNNGGTVNEQDYFTQEHTIDQLYKLAYPQYNKDLIKFYSLPLKLILDSIMTQNVLVDFSSATKKLSAAHFDSEAFLNGSRRILQFRSIIVNDARTPNKDLTNARELLGQLLHTLQDFYAHSNWIEMNQTDINQLIGVNETIGKVAGPNQATCTSNGCTRIEKSCTLWQQITLGTCPLVYYDCQNNILPEINNQQLLTSGYSVNQHNENNDPIEKPTNVEKCSHGSVYDDSSNIPALGGINKDATNLIFSPHANLHFQAASFAEKATERFFNDLRRDIGDENFDHLFCINPLQTEAQAAANSFDDKKRFRFFTPSISASLENSNNLLTNLQNWITKHVNNFKSIFSNIFASKKDIPTYDISDLNVKKTDLDNPHEVPYIFANVFTGRKKRLIDALRQRQ